MARQIRTRKPAVDRRSGDQPGNSPGLPVLQNQRVYGPRAQSTENVQRFVNDISNMIVKNHREEMIGEAEEDALTGSGSDQELEDNHVYMSRFSQISGETDALEVAATIEQDLAAEQQRAYDNNEEFDPTEFLNGQFAPLEQSDNFGASEEYRESVLRAKAELMPLVTEKSASIAAAHQLQQNQNNLLKRASARFNTGNVTQTDFHEIERIGGDLGLTHKQIREVALDQVGARMENAESKEEIERIYGETEKFFTSKDKGAWLRREPDIAEQRDQAVKVVEARQREERLEQAAVYDDAFLDAMSDIRANPTEWNVDRIREATNNGKWGVDPRENRMRAMQARRARQKALEERNEKLAEETNRATRFNIYSNIPDNPSLFTRLTSEERREYREEYLTPRVEQAFKPLRRLGTTLSNSEDPQEQQDALNSLRASSAALEPLIAHARATGEGLPILGDSMAQAAETLDTKQLASMAPVYAAMKAQYGTGAIHGISADQAATLDRFFEMTSEEDWTPEEATERLQNLGREETSRHARRFEEGDLADQLDQAIKDVMNPTDPEAWIRSNTLTATNGLEIADELRRNIGYAVSISTPPEKAIANAVSHFKDNHVFFDGNWLNNEGLPAETMARFEVAKPATIEHVAETNGLDLPDPESIRMVPVPGAGKFGEFYLANPEGGLNALIKNADGELVTVNVHEEARERFARGKTIRMQHEIDNPRLSARAMELIGPVVGGAHDAAEGVGGWIGENIVNDYKEYLRQKQEKREFQGDEQYSDDALLPVKEIPERLYGAAQSVDWYLRGAGRRYVGWFNAAGENIIEGSKAAKRFFTQEYQMEQLREQGLIDDDNEE